MTLCAVRGTTPRQTYSNQGARRASESHPAVHTFVHTSSVEATFLRSGSSSRAETEAESKLNALDSSTAISSYGHTFCAADALVLEANTGRQYESKPTTNEGRLLTTTLSVGRLYGERDLKTIWETLKCVKSPATGFYIGPDKVMQDWVSTQTKHKHMCSPQSHLRTQIILPAHLQP